MSEMSAPSKSYLLRFVVMIVIWIGILAIGLTGPGLLQEQVDSSINLINDETAAGDGFDLLQERFEIDGSAVQHIIILHIEDTAGMGDFEDTDWQQYTYFMTGYIFEEMNASGYDAAISEPIARETLNESGLPPTYIEETVDGLTSEDASTTLIFLESSTLDIEVDEGVVREHVHQIRDLLQDVDGYYEYVEGIEDDLRTLQPFLPEGFLVDQLPTITEAGEVNRLLTGTVANVEDTLVISEESFRQSEVIAAVAVFIILALVFRTPLGIFIPLISTAAALLPAYLITSFVGQTDLFEVNEFLPSVIAMIGIAIGVDYNLFNLVRYREEYRKRRAGHEKNGTWNKETRNMVQVETAKVMNRTAGTAVMYSGFTVVIGFSTLALVGEDFSLGMAIGVSIVVLLSVIAARTLTPAILALFGRYLDWPAPLSGARRDIRRKNDQEQKPGFWVRWSKLVMRYPLVFLLLGILTLAPFVVLSMDTDLSFSLTKSLPDGAESREGYEILQENFNLGDFNPYLVVLDFGNETNSAWNSDVINSINDFATDVLQFSGTHEQTNTDLNFETVSSVSVFKNFTGSNLVEMNYTDIQTLFAAPDFFITGFINFTIPIIEVNYDKLLYLDHVRQHINWDMDNNTITIEITSNLDPGSGAAFELVDILKERVDIHFGQYVGDELVNVYVTGLTALFKDSSDAMYGNVPQMLVVAVLLIFIVLTILFRSLLLPIKAILTIAGSILFGLGTLVLIFQRGYFQELTIFDYTLWQADTAGITYFIPVFLFTTILGLGMDYSIFILSRVREEYENGADMRDSVALGLSKTAGVITSAATIMIVTFMVFALSPMLILKMLGVAMAVSIFIDATIARVILMPSAMRLAGKYNFWLPKWLKRILPEVKLDH